MLVGTFSDLMMEVRTRLVRLSAEETRAYRSFDRIRPFVTAARDHFHQYRIMRRRGVNLWSHWMRP